jgi:acetylornithine deacetylase
VSERDGNQPTDPGALAAHLVRIESINPRLADHGSGERAMAAVCADWLRQRGFGVELLEAEPGRPSVVARLVRGAGRTVLLNGHLDTVGEDGMTVPARGQVLHGRLYGRGACDMKGGVAALMTAAAALGDGDGWQGELVVALTADEEHASIGMSRVLAAGLRADVAVVCEPTSLAVMPAHKGFVWIEVEVRGRAAHGSRADIGVDAVRHAGRLLARLDRIDASLRAAPPHALLGHGSVHAGTITGGSAPSVYPERCTLTLERRTLPHEPPETALAEVQELIAELRSQDPAFTAEARLVLARPGSDVDPASPLVQGLLAALERQGQARVVAGMSAWVDAALLNAAGIPAVCFGPGSIEQAHAADEWIDIEEIACASATLRDFLLSFFGRATA